MPSGPQNLHVTRWRQKQAAEHARWKAEKERKDAAVAKAREVLAMNKTHKKMTPQEKEARKSKVILLITLFSELCGASRAGGLGKGSRDLDGSSDISWVHVSHVPC